MYSKYFEYITDKVAAAKREADILSSQLNHHGLAGQIREIALRNCVEPFLTHSFHCGSGKVIDTAEKISDQLDLIIYQRKTAPPIMFASELGLFPIECVKYVFEVKSTLNASEVKDAIKKFKSLHELKSYPVTVNGETVYGENPVTVLFAFSSDISGSEIDRYLKYDDGEAPQTNVICVLGKGYWFWNKGCHGVLIKPEMPPMFEFALFITGFINTLVGEEMSLKSFSPGAYVNVDKVLEKFELN